MKSPTCFYDEVSSGERTLRLRLQLESDRISARELVRRRVEHEVAEANATQGPSIPMLVEPTPAEQVLNGPASVRELDPERQVQVALEAFGRNQFFLLVGDRQITSLDEEVVLGDGVDVCFLRLLPIVGG